jgi:hypothetical protein
MQGYVKNEGTRAYFVCQRQIPPGGKVTFDSIYKSVGKKSGLEYNFDFIEWVKLNIFKRGSWGYYGENDGPLVEKPVVKKSNKIATKKVSTKKAVPKVPKVPKVSKKTSAKTSSKKELDARGAGRNMKRDTNMLESNEITPAAIIEAPYDEARSLIEKTKDRTVLKKALKLSHHISNKEQHMRHIVKRMEQVY